MVIIFLLLALLLIIVFFHIKIAEKRKERLLIHVLNLDIPPEELITSNKYRKYVIQYFDREKTVKTYMLMATNKTHAAYNFCSDTGINRFHIQKITHL